GGGDHGPGQCGQPAHPAARSFAVAREGGVHLSCHQGTGQGAVSHQGGLGAGPQRPRAIAMPTISRRERSLIGVGLAGTTLVGAYLLLVEPVIIRNAELAQLLPAREATLEQRRALVAQLDQVATEQQALAARLEAESARLLPGATVALAASELQKLVKEVGAGAKVEVRSERVLPAVDLAGLQEVPIEIAVAGS